MGVRYGRGAGAHVTLRWNTSARPYIEVVDVTGLDWSD